MLNECFLEIEGYLVIKQLPSFPLEKQDWESVGDQSFKLKIMKWVVVGGETMNRHLKLWAIYLIFEGIGAALGLVIAGFVPFPQVFSPLSQEQVFAMWHNAQHTGFNVDSTRNNNWVLRCMHLLSYAAN